MAASLSHDTNEASRLLLHGCHGYRLDFASNQSHDAGDDCDRDMSASVSSTRRHGGRSFRHDLLEKTTSVNGARVTSLAHAVLDFLDDLFEQGGGVWIARHC